jgi:hypothetical protein
MRLLSSLALLAVVALAAACSGTSTGGMSMPRHVAQPEDATNPIILKFEGGASHADVANLVASALSSQGIETFQVVPEDGLVETRWIDTGTWDPTTAARSAPANERSVTFIFQSGRGVNPETQETYGMGLVSLCFYQPDPNKARTQPRTYRENCPTGHAGYQLLLRVQTLINQELVRNQIPYQMIQPKSIGGDSGSGGS